MTGTVYRFKVITRAMLRASPGTLYVFGDNMKRRGFGGQAKAMRGEPNSVGVPTKWDPTRREGAYFRDADLGFQGVRLAIDNAFLRIEQHLADGGDVVLPEAGLGTGLAELPERAPKIAAYIERRIAMLTEEEA